jgi:hypothetical protein
MMAVQTVRGAMAVAVLMVTAVGVAACGDGMPGRAAGAAPGHTPVHIDSVFPIEEEVRRFRAALSDSATELSGSAASAEALVLEFMTALEGRDAQTLSRLTITPAEFIDLYYPHTRFTARPYEMAPGLVWFQLENYGSKGINRALDRFGGRPLGFVGHACETETVEGPNRLLSGCVVHVSNDVDGETTLSLFGTMIERDGVWKFVSYANGL